MAIQLIQVPEGDEIKPGDEIFTGHFFITVKDHGLLPLSKVQPGQIVRRKFNPSPVEYRDAFSMNE